MRLRSLDISGFRGIPDLHLEFPEQINVLVGVNGVGKSAVLDCTAIMLSRLIGRIRSTAGTGRFFAAAVDALYGVPKAEIGRLPARGADGRFLEFHTTIEQVLSA